MPMNLKEFSKAIGLSQTTVSRALGGYPEVSAKTRSRVETAAKELGYSPNSRAKGLATGRSMMIGHVLPPATQHEMVNPIFGDFVAGTSQVLAEHGYSMTFTRVTDESEEQAYRSLRATGSVDGVILQGPSVNDDRIALLTEIGLPFVVHGRSSGVSTPYSWVDVNNKRSFQRATEFLIQLGHDRIALINGLEGMDFAARRRAGYLAGLAGAGLPHDLALMASAEMTEIYGYETTMAMLALANPPTAILVSSMISALGVKRALREKGLLLGRDISVITHDDDLSYQGNGGDRPVFTATRSSVRAAGEIAAAFLMDRIANPDAPLTNRLLEAELLVGSSTGPATA